MEVSLLDNRDIDLEAWNDLLEKSAQSSVFVKPWFLDVVTNGSWQAYVAKSQNGYEGVMPIFNTQKGLFSLSRQPRFSKYWGIINRQLQGNYPQLHHAKQVYQAILGKASGAYAMFDYVFSPDAVYPQQAQWMNYSLTPYFTYKLDLQNIEEMRKGYSKTVRKKVRKLDAQAFILREEEDGSSVIAALQANREVGKQIFEGRFDELLKQIVQTGYAEGAARIFSLFTPGGKLASSGFVLLDKHSAYLLSAYAMPNFRNQGVMNIWMDKVFQELAPTHKVFDFFGSGIESIEAFFRSFGAQSHTYFRVRQLKFPLNIIA